MLGAKMCRDPFDESESDDETDVGSDGEEDGEEAPVIPRRSASLLDDERLDPATYALDRDLRLLMSACFANDITALRFLLLRSPTLSGNTRSRLSCSFPLSAFLPKGRATSTGIGIGVMSTAAWTSSYTRTSSIDHRRDAFTPLSESLASCITPEAMAMLRAGRFRPTLTEDIRMTPLAIACVAGRVEIVKVLVEEFGCRTRDWNNVALFMAVV
ncbi:hypothetical protein HK101_005744, partial [Irineochytrium annulatum]